MDKDITLKIEIFFKDFEEIKYIKELNELMSSFENQLKNISGNIVLKTSTLEMNERRSKE